MNCKLCIFYLLTIDIYILKVDVIFMWLSKLFNK